MRVYIPSMSRADERVTRGPAAQMPRDWPVTYVVPEEQAPAYRAILDQYGMRHVEIHGTAVRGIARTREAIGRVARMCGEPVFCMIDDDIGFLVRRDRDNWQLRAAEPEEVAQSLLWIEDEIRSGRADHASLSAREGNNRIGVGSVGELVDRNTRMLRVLAYQTDRFLAMEHGRVDVMEDFDISLQLLRSGGSNAVSYWWAQGQRMTNEAGGCSTYRTHEVHERSARRLAELHPGYVSLRQKTNKTDREGFGTRTEVTIAWKRAARGAAG